MHAPLIQTPCPSDRMHSLHADSPIPAIWQHILASSTAGATNVFVTNPLWVAKTRLQIQGFHSIPSPDKTSSAPFKYRGTFHALWSIARYEGVAGMYSGLSPSLVGVSHIAIQVPLYEELKRIAVHKREASCGKCEVTSLDIIFSSSLAKMIASAVTYPHEVIRSRMHASGRGGFSAFVPICKQVRRLLFVTDLSRYCNVLHWDRILLPLHGREGVCSLCAHVLSL